MKNSANSLSNRPVVVAWVGMICLAIAMGIGRFAFTPLLPMMLNDGVIDLPTASGLATANYIGYWMGASLCAIQPFIWSRWKFLPPIVHTVAIKYGLILTVIFTFLMAVPASWSWPLLRFGSGLASALVFVYTSGWCLARLSELAEPKLAGLIFVGPGIGIVISGVAASAMVANELTASSGWSAFGVLALLLSIAIWTQLEARVNSGPPVTNNVKIADGAITLFGLAYGLAGFGYIVSATFLPVIARQALPPSIWLDMFWPIFGLAVSMGAFITTKFPMHWDRRYLLIGCYLLQAIGVVLGVWLPTLFGFALGSLLVGLPLTALTLFAMQEVRRLRPEGTAAYIGLLTTTYGIGQIAGPLLVTYILKTSVTAEIGFTHSLYIAASALVLGIALFAVLIVRDREASSSKP